MLGLVPARLPQKLFSHTVADNQPVTLGKGQFGVSGGAVS